jgi:hypothetical protein
VNDEHVLAFIKAIDRADLDTIGVFALDALLVDDVGHSTSRFLLWRHQLRRAAGQLLFASGALLSIGITAA